MNWSEKNEKNFEYYYNSYKYGTYMQVGLSDDTKTIVLALIKKIKPKEPITEEDLHVTLVYSEGKGNPAYQPSRNVTYSGTPIGFELFGEGVLVIELDSDDLQSRHENILNAAFLRHSYTPYRPHITIAYDFDGKMPNADLLTDSNGYMPRYFFKGESIDAIRP